MDGDPGLVARLLRRPEVIHGLRNLLQNAVDFARAKVWIDGSCHFIILAASRALLP